MKKVAILTISIILHQFYSFAQQTSEKISVIPPSPTAGTMSIYGEIPFNHSTGTANISIPLIEVKEGSINLPMSLSYNYSGYKPDEPTGIAGLGWSLLGGGVITRTTKGLKDESDNGYFNIGSWVHQKLTDYEDLLITSEADVFYGVNSGTHDGEPDIFNFTFPGNSGKFFMGSDGQFHVVSQKKLKIEYVDSTGSLDLLHPMLSNSIIRWTLTDESGTIYKFKNVEYSWSLFNDENTLKHDKSISGWYLSEILSPNGDKVEFIYTNPSPLYPRVQASYTESLTTITAVFGYSASVTDHHGVNINYSEEIFLTKIKGTNWDLDFEYDDYTQSILGGAKTSYLKKLDKIKYYDKVSTPGTPQLIKEINLSIEGYGPLLNEIKEVSGSSKNNVHKFEYFGDLPNISYMGTKSLDFWGYFNASDNETMIPFFGANREPSYADIYLGLLKKVIYPTGGFSSFDYEKNTYSYVKKETHKAVRIITMAKEFQYLNGDIIFGSGDTISLSLPTDYQIFVSTSGGAPEDTLQDVRHCPVNKFRGTLSPGDYHAMSEEIMTETCLDLAPLDVTITVRLVYKVVDTTGVVDGKNMNEYGGLRVKQVTYGDSNSVYHKLYSYQDFDDPDRSSGIIGQLGNYELTQQTFLAIRPTNIFQWKSEVNAVTEVNTTCYYSEPYNSMQLSPLMYYNVKETILSDSNIIGHETKYTFTSYFDNYSDGLGEEIGFDGTNKIGPIESFDFARSNVKQVEKLRYPDNQIIETDSSVYPPKDQLEFYNYHYSKSLFGMFFASINVSRIGGESQFKLYYDKKYKTFSSWHYLKEKITRTFGSNNDDYVETNTTYHYDNLNHLQLTRTRTTKSNGDISETRTKYPLDYDSVSTLAPYIRKMISTHMVNYPIETVTVLEKDASNKFVVDAEITTYKEFPGNANNDTLVLPYKKFSFLNNSYLLPLSSYSPYTGTSDEVSSANFREVIKYNAYDTGGNVLNLLYNKKDNVSYLWSYNSQYPVAEIKNATATEVSSALTALGTSVSSLGAMTDSGTLKTKLGGLRAGLPNSLITSYLYKPLVGVTTVTSPNLLNTHYEYDVFNRLRFVKDNDLKTVKRIDYHYATE